jgi:hypothetical protein
MTDYHPLIVRAVEGLDKSTGEARRALYERARTALVTQLRSVEPALSESEITKERLALEEAIRKVEAEAARKSRTEPRGEPRPSPEGRAPAAPPPRRERTNTNANSPADKPLRSAREGLKAEPPRATPDPHSAAEPETPRPAAPPTARERLLSGRTTTLTEGGIKGFRNVVNEVHDLGAATAKAAQSARDTRDQYGAGSPQQFPAEDSPGPSPRGRQSQFDAAWDSGNYDAHLRSLEPSYELEDEGPQMPQPTARPQPPRAAAEEEYESERPTRSYRGLIKPLVAVIVFLAVVAAIVWAWPKFAGLYQYVSHIGARQPSQTKTETPASQPKFPGRVPQEQAQNQPSGSGAPATQPTPAVAQRVVLYEEDPNDPQGRRFVGSAIWRTETVSPGAGLAPELAVRADLEIPERRMTVTWSLRRNTDQALPASHTIEIMFNLPADFPGGGIANVPGILMKQSEQARGTPLAGLAVKVTNNFFLVGLSAVATDMQRNIQLLKERPWFDIPVVYTNGGRAILAMEKGPPGDRAFNDAFAAWEKK